MSQPGNKVFVSGDSSIHHKNGIGYIWSRYWVLEKNAHVQLDTMLESHESFNKTKYGESSV